MIVLEGVPVCVIDPVAVLLGVTVLEAVLDGVWVTELVIEGVPV